MTDKPKQTAILYIDKNRFDFYKTSNPTALSLVFPPEMVKDMEIVDTENLKSIVLTFIDQNKLSPVNLILILSENITFSQDFPASLDGKQDEEIHKFLDNIPFEHISFKKVPIEKGVRLVAVNKDYY